MDFETFTAITAMIALTFVEIVYLRDTIKKKIKPHMFSWFVWAVLMSISGAIQFFEGSHMAAMAQCFGGFLCLLIAVVAFRKGKKDITRFDWFCFIGAMSAIPVWVMTNDPLYAALLITGIDGLGFLPTYRTTWKNPRNENISMYFCCAATDALICLSLAPITAAAILYPASGLLTNSGLAIVIILRKAYLASHKGKKRSSKKKLAPAWSMRAVFGT